jgi:GNAT superfamily N-acetyltransferase
VIDQEGDLIMDIQRPDPIVANLELARHLERAEALANAEFVKARAVAFPEVGCETIEVAGALAMYDGVDSPCTQTFGLGLFDPVTTADMERVEQFFHRRGATSFHEVCPLAPSEFIELLNQRKYHPFEFSNVLFQSIEPRPTRPSQIANSLAVRITGRGEDGLWARTAAEGWRDAAPQYVDYILNLEHVSQHRPQTHNFLVEKAGEPIAAGALCVFDGVALLAGACTIPKWRNQGAQRALLAHRLQFATDQGCNLAMMVAAPGTASQRNAERAGFRIAYTRIKWRLPPSADTATVRGRPH